MYFKTKRDSDTGKKFEELLDKMKVVRDSQVAFGEKYGFTKSRESRSHLRGRFSACLLVGTVDTKAWKTVNNSKEEWMPRMNTKAGQAIQAEIDALPIIERQELNDCVAYNNGPWNHIGFNLATEGWFGFECLGYEGYKPPTDCEEITETEYKTLFK